MLVYYYLPLGYADINGKPLYGRSLGKPPTRISYKEWKDYKDMVEMAAFTPDYISKAVGREFPLNISFTIDTIKTLDYRTLQKMATFFKINAILPETRLIYALRKVTRDL